MILTFNNNTGKMETVAGAGILPKIPTLVPDEGNVIAQFIEQNNASIYPATGAIAAATGRDGTPYPVPEDCFIRALVFAPGSNILGSLVIDGIEKSRVSSVGGQSASIYPEIFVQKGAQVVVRYYNNSTAGFTYTRQWGFVTFMRPKLITVTPAVIDVGTNPGYSLAEAPVMRTLADGTQEQLQTLDGDPIFQKTYTGQISLSSTMVEVALDDFTNKALIGVVPDYSYSYAPSTMIFNTWPKNDTNTWIEAIRKDNQLKIRARSSDVGTVRYVLTVRYCAL